MGCVNGDGTLSASARAVLAALREPRSADEIAAATGQALFKVRSGLREMESAGLVERAGDGYVLSAAGRERIRS